MPRHRSVLAVLVLALALVVGCGGSRIGAVNPKPDIRFGPDAPQYSVGLEGVQDVLFIEGITVRDFRHTLSNGFASGFGAHLAPVRTNESVHLLIDMVAGDRVREGKKTLALHYRARWILPSGEVLTSFAGTAVPRNTELAGKKNLEDVVAVMIEQMMLALIEAGRRAPATPPPPVDDTPRLPPNKPPGT